MKKHLSTALIAMELAVALFTATPTQAWYMPSGLIGGSSCTGMVVGGFCWYYGASGADCDSTCAAQGKTTNMSGTKDYAGSGGTDANCTAVASAFGFSFFGAGNCSGFATGCYTTTSFGTNGFRCTNTTTSNSTKAGNSRFCACS